MMSIPFFGLFAGFCLVWAGRRAAAMALWLASMAMLVLLFRAHATDSLALSF
jgi:hypothetical protein